MTVTAVFVLALGICEAARAGAVSATVHIMGRGTVNGNGFQCKSTNYDPNVIGATCIFFNEETWPSDFARDLGTDADGGWDYASWQGCESEPRHGVCRVRAWPWNTREWTTTVRFKDIANPSVTLSGAGAAGTSAWSDFDFLDDEIASHSCFVDTIQYPCSKAHGSPGKFSAGGFAEGPHTMSINAVDKSGRVGTAAWQFTAVDTSMGSAPPTLAATRTAVFRFRSKAGNQFRCELEGVRTWECGTPVGANDPTLYEERVTVPADGTWSFRVRARTGGFEDDTPAAHRWTVDTKPPETSITSGPTDGSVLSVGTATFGYATGDGEPTTTTFWCSVDGAAYAPCPGTLATLSGLGVGSHTFAVRARDAAGNNDPSPATRSWRVAAVDSDGDGTVPPADCDEGDARRFPGAFDVADDGIDQDCNGLDAENFDRDRDGFQRPNDCDDTEPAIRPGVPDLPQNGVDENCDGVDAAWETLPSSITWRHKFAGARTVFKSIRVINIVPGSTVVATCKGGGCPRKPVRARGTGALLLESFMNKKLRTGAVIEVRVTKPGHMGVVKRLKIGRRNRDPVLSTRCWAPTAASQPGRCP
jgi:hypothetical protein